MMISACVLRIRNLRSSSFFNSVYFDLQYDEISLTFTAESVSLCSFCSHVVVFFSVCEVVVVPYVHAVVAVTVMCILLLVLHVCMLRDCEGARVTAMLVWAMEEVLLW